MFTRRYLVSTKNVDAILTKMVEGVAPEKFNIEHLQSIGFSSSSDRGIVPLLKDLGFLTGDGTPTQRYHAFRNRSQSKAVMAEALKEAYQDVFLIREIPTTSDREAIEGLFKSKHNSTDKVAQMQAMTFFALLKNADLTATRSLSNAEENSDNEQVEENETTRPNDELAQKDNRGARLTTELHYTIQVHLPATKDIEVFNAIFRSLKENLL